MQKEQAIALIKGRIIDEQRNKPNLDWQEIAARKIYSSLFEKTILLTVSVTSKDYVKDIIHLQQHG